MLFQDADSLYKSSSLRDFVKSFPWIVDGDTVN